MRSLSNGFRARSRQLDDAANLRTVGIVTNLAGDREIRSRLQTLVGKDTQSVFVQLRASEGLKVHRELSMRRLSEPQNKIAHESVEGYAAPFPSPELGRKMRSE
jgi:hypothetical protein